MIRSMTAFNRVERSESWGSLSIELRSVNHRYLDISPRLPEELRQLEPLVRERLGKRLSRGKIECSMRYRSATGAAAEVEVNWPYVESLLAAANAVKDREPTLGTMSPLDVLRFPGATKEPETDMEPIIEAAKSLMEKAIDGFIEAREREGRHLAETIDDRVTRLGELSESVYGHREALYQGVRQKLLARLDDLDVPADQGRLEQELAYIAQRLDVEEELDRLRGHVKEVKATLKRKEPVGRRLDFLMQELNREANTLSSKSNDLDTTQAAVEMKVLIEQMREQVQNIE